MRSMSASLQGAVKGYDRAPAVAVLVGDVPPETPRLAELSQTYAGSEGDLPVAACSLADGRICRAYLTTDGRVRAQVVTPGPGAPWSTWTVVATGQSTYTGVCHVAVGCAAGSNVPYLYQVGSDGVSVSEWVWNGSGWTSNGLVASALTTIGGLAVDAVSADRPVFFVEIAGPIKVTYWDPEGTPSAWSAVANDGGVYTACTLAASYSAAEGNTRLALVARSPSILQSLSWSKAAGFSSASTLLAAGTGTGYGYAYPGLQGPQGTPGRWVYTWSETGPAPVGTSPMVGFTSQVDQIVGAAPWDPGGAPGGSAGVVCFLDQPGATWWFCTPSQVWNCPADTGSVADGQRISFGQDQVFAIDIDARELNRPAKAKITLLNEGGALATAGQAGSYRGLRPWSQVAVSLGYHTGQGVGGQGLGVGDEGCWQIPLWVEAVIFHDEMALGVPLVTLECTDAWGVLDALGARSSQTVSGVSADRLAKNLWWHVSGDSVSASPVSLTGVTPLGFTVRAGESLGGQLRRIAELCGVAFVFGTFDTAADGVGWDSVSCRGVDYGDGSGGSVWSFGDAGQPVVWSEIAVSTISSANGAEVAGASTTSISRNWDEVYLTWRDRRARVTDKTLNTQALTDFASAKLAGLLEGEQRGGYLQCFGNPGLEVGDVVSVTIPTAPLSATSFVVAGLRHVYARDLSGAGTGPTGRFLTTVYLEGTH